MNIDERYTRVGGDITGGDKTGLNIAQKHALSSLSVSKIVAPVLHQRLPDPPWRLVVRYRLFSDLSTLRLPAVGSSAASR